jgi:predicted RNA binding protein YcfA (HicA-like mRNA interferase family)
MKLPLASSDKILKFLTKRGFIIVRWKGSHISLHKKVGERTLLVVVPQKKQVKKGTLLSILRQARISKEEFLEEFK